MNYYIATVVNAREYVVLKDREVVAGPFVTAAEAVKARDELHKSDTSDGSEP